jgi:hypothetical protein
MNDFAQDVKPASRKNRGGFLRKHGWKFAAGIALIVLLTLVFGFGEEAKAMFFPPPLPQECSQPPEPYRIINKESAHTKDGQEIYIVRAVVGSGEGTLVEGSTSLPFPDCYSADPAFVKVVDLSATLDSTGEDVNIIVGIVGMWEATNPPQEQP